MSIFIDINITEATVAELVRAAQAGDRDAFGELYRRFERVILAITQRRLGNFAEAQELCQDVFVQAMEKIDQLRVPECFAGWIRSIAVRMSINRAVRRGPDFSAEPETLEATLSDGETPEDFVLQDEREEQLRAGMDRLRDMDRETLQAFYVDGQSLIEMSDRFDAPLGTIKRRLHVARKRLAQEIEDLVAF